ncbi:MAG: MaoC family dehydratase N-terminal domain-containing protein [Deltaproteobacteria bacterium]|nr:MaoC family dehydratase N-terminal domain-containing protein [Deltaproteobacteria bacterium]
MLYFEDIQVGDSQASTEEYELTADEIIDFCTQWDPQPFHVDEEVAAATSVGKLFTSALHSMAVAMRMGVKEPSATVMGLGWDEVRFETPACVGDRLRLRGEIIETRLSKSQAGLGIVRTQLYLTNQRGDTVIRFKAAALIRQRPRES